MSGKDEIFLTAEEMDAIGEIMNISMGSAATAVSAMLEKQVTITTPNLVQDQFGNIDCSDLEPALIVKIRYVEGIEGDNVIMLRRRDIQIILNLLMGNEFPDQDDEFEFDDMSMSAACEVMNQMMGSSATALSEILGIPINISIPEATLVETKSDIRQTFTNIDSEEQVVEISFKMKIKDIVDTTFSCFLPVALASKVVSMAAGGPEREPIPAPSAPVSSTQEHRNTAPAPVAAVYEAPPVPQPTLPVPVTTPAPPQPEVAAYEPKFEIPVPPMQEVPHLAQPTIQPVVPPQQAAAMAQPPMGQMPGYPYPASGQMPYMQNPYGYMQPQAYQQSQAFNVQNAEFPDFSQQIYKPVMPVSNMGLLMNVHLDVSVVIGRAKRKIRDIMEFGQGTVLELDKQTGAPAEIMVNGQLLAYGDVVVVGDNFGIRITEIVGTKDLLDSL